MVEYYLIVSDRELCKLEEAFADVCRVRNGYVQDLDYERQTQADRVSVEGMCYKHQPTQMKRLKKGKKDGDDE